MIIASASGVAAGSPPSTPASSPIVAQTAEMDTRSLPDPHRTRPGVIVGATVGSVVGVFIILFAIFWWKGKGCIDRKKSKDAADHYTPYPVMSASRVTFATAQTSRSARSDAPSPAPKPAESQSFSIDLERANVSRDSSPSPCPLDGEDHNNTLSPTDAPSESYHDHGLAPEWTHPRSPSRASVNSIQSRISKLSRISKTSLGASLGGGMRRSSSQNLKHYTTTTERLRDRPFSTIYDAESVAWGRSNASNASNASENGEADVDVRNIPEVTVHDPELRTGESSGTPSPADTLGRHHSTHGKNLTARERMIALYTSSQQNLHSGEEGHEYHYTPTHKKRESR